jgi:hypothetical protein
MAHDVQRPHDKLFRTVFADHGEAAALLRAHLPESLARDLRWSTLTLQDRSFVDPDLRDTESDLLFSIRRKAGAPPAWLYVLVEHQSRPDRWIRFRLLKYCCRIWDRSRAQFPRERRLRPHRPPGLLPGAGPLAPDLIKAVLGFRRLSSRSPQNPPRRLDVGLSSPRGEEIGRLHRGNLLRDRRRHELIDAGAVFLADLGDSRLQGRRKTQRIRAGLSLQSSILLNACWGDSTAIPNRPGGAGRVPDDAGRLARLTARRDPASRRQ